MKSALAAVVLVVAAVAVIALTRGDDGRGTTDASVSATNPGRASTSADALLRTCRERVDAQRPTRTSRDIDAGPVTFNGLNEAAALPAGDFQPLRGRYLVLKAVTEVDASKKVRITIAPQDRGHASLLYDQRRYRDDGRYRLDDGLPSVRLHACAKDQPSSIADRSVGPTTQFNGGFIVTRPSCVRVQVSVEGSPKTTSRTIRFGVARSACD